MKTPLSLKSLISFLLTLELVQALSRYITIKDKKTNNTVHLFGSLHFDAAGRQQHYPGLSKEQAENSILEEYLAIKIITQKDFSNAYFEVPDACINSLVLGTERLFCNEFERKGLEKLWHNKGFETAIGQQFFTSRFPVQYNYDGTLRALTPSETSLILDYPLLGACVYNVLSPKTHIQLLAFMVSSIGGGFVTRNWASGAKVSAVGISFFSLIGYIAVEQYLQLFMQKSAISFMQDVSVSSNEILPKMPQIILSHLIESFKIESKRDEAILAHRDKRFAESINKILQAESSPQKSSTNDSALDHMTHEVKKDSLVVFGALHLPGIYALLSDNPNYEILEHDVHGMIKNHIAPYRSEQKKSFKN